VAQGDKTGGSSDVEVKEIPNYKLSEFKWGDERDGDFMLGTFKGGETFTGDMARRYPGDVQVRVRLRSARIVDSYLTYQGRRISEPVTPAVERVLLPRAEWNKAPDCEPPRQLFTYKERVGRRISVCQV